MKKIIDGKKYDTETAKFLEEWWNGLCITDFHYVREELYIKKTGEYFLYGEGGAASSYAKSTGSGYTDGWGITPLTKEKAMKWVEKRCNDSYEEIFGECEE